MAKPNSFWCFFRMPNKICSLLANKCYYFTERMQVILATSRIEFSRQLGTGEQDKNIRNTSNIRFLWYLFNEVLWIPCCIIVSRKFSPCKCVPGMLRKLQIDCPNLRKFEMDSSIDIFTTDRNQKNRCPMLPIARFTGAGGVFDRALGGRCPFPSPAPTFH